MKKRVLILCVLVGLLIFGGLLVKEGLAAGKKLYAMGTTQSSSSHYAYWVAAAKAINSRVPEVNVTVVETQGAMDNFKRMEKGEFDLALSIIHIHYQAYYGLEAWKGKPVRNQLALWIYQAAPQNFVIRSDSGVKTVYDLEGRPFNPGMRGSGTEKTVEKILDALKVKPKLYRGGLEDTVAAIKDKKVVGYVKSGAGLISLDASSLDISTFTSIQVLNFTDEDIKKVNAKYPYLSTIEVPAGIHKDLPAYKTFAILVGAVANKDIPEHLTYKMVKAVWESFNMQVAAFPSCKGVNIPKLTLETCPFPLHPGAIKYYRELGYKVPDRLIPKN